MRYFIEFAYNGTNYNGFQKQPNATSIQETLTKALHILIDETVEITGAGRTDKGVHAKQMFAHFDVNTFVDCALLVSKLNVFLPKDIAIHAIFEVGADIHARFSATARKYQYYIHTQKNPFLEHLSWYCYKKLDVELMNKACEILFDYIDFECFSKVKTEVFTYNCSIKEAFWELHDDQLIFTIKADRFLRNMVRAVVGTMIDVGSGKINLETFKSIIESKNRSNAGFSVPAHGLFLVKIDYPFLTINE